MRLQLNTSTTPVQLQTQDFQPGTNQTSVLQVGIGWTSRIWQKPTTPVVGMAPGARLRKIIGDGLPLALKVGLLSATMLSPNAAHAAPWEVNLAQLRESSSSSLKDASEQVKWALSEEGGGAGTCVAVAKAYLDELPGKIDDGKISVLEAGANIEAILRWLDVWRGNPKDACKEAAQVPLPDPEVLLRDLLAQSTSLVPTIPQSEVLCLAECIDVYRKQLAHANEQGLDSDGEWAMKTAKRLATVLAGVEHRLTMLQNWHAWPTKIEAISKEIDGVIAGADAKPLPEGADREEAMSKLTRAKTRLQMALVRAQAGINDPPVSDDVEAAQGLIAEAKQLLDPKAKVEKKQEEAPAPGDHWVVTVSTP